jgi:predicted DNA-binding transcriptional regulator AlpA
MLKTRAGDIIGTTPLLRYSDLKARKIVNNRATLANWIKNYGFPPGKMLGPNTRTWTPDEIAEYYASRPDGGPHVEGE